MVTLSGSWVRAVVGPAAVLLVAIAARPARGAEVVLWENAPGVAGAAGNFSVVRVDGSGVETASNRCADDFVAPDLNGTGGPVVLTRIDAEIVSDGAVGAGHEAIAEVWTDDGGGPGERVLEFGAGRAVQLVATQGSLQRWLFRFDGVAEALTPGVRYWLVVAVRTPDTSNQNYFRQRAVSVSGLQAHRIEFGGATPEKGFDVVQGLFGYQVAACPEPVIDGALPSGPSGHDASAAFVQSGRAEIVGGASACGGAGACAGIDDAVERGAVVHSFWNSAGTAACVEVTLTQPCGEGGAHALAYLDGFDARNLCANAVGDAGAGASAVQAFSFDVEPGGVFHVVVHEVEPGPGCAYTLSVRGLAACCEKCAGDANGDGAVNFGDLVAVFSEWLASYEVTGPGDGNCDGAVNFGDVVAALGNWLGECSVAR